MKKSTKKKISKPKKCYLSAEVPHPLYNRIVKYAEQEFTSIRRMVSKMLHESDRARSKKLK